MANIKVGASTSTFDNSMKKMLQEARELKSEFKLSKIQLDSYGTSVTALTNKQNLINRSIQNINSQISIQQNKYNTLNNNYSTQVKNLQSLNTKLNEEETKLKNVEKELGKNSNEYKQQKTVVDNLKDAYKRQVEAIDKTKTSMSNTRIKINNLKTEETRLKGELNKTNTEIKEQTSKLTLVKNGFTKLNTSVANYIRSNVTLKSSLSAIGTGLTTLSNKTTQALTKFNSFADNILKKSAKIVSAVAGYSVLVGANFEQAMSKVQAISGATGDDLKALQDKAEEMGKKTSKSATESAEALSYMALAGWDTKEMLEGLEPILRLSEAGGTDLATTSDLVTDSMSALGVSVDNLTRYLDICAKAQNKSNTSANQMLEAYINCGGMFKNFNTSLEESASLLGILANRGIKGSEAGNSLNSVMINLMGTTKRTSDAMETLGLSAYDSEGNFRGIETVLKDVKVKMADMTDEQRDYIASCLGGKTQMDTLNALLNGLGDEYDGLKEQITNCDGALNEMANTMMDNVKGEFVIFKSAVEALGNTIYKSFSGNLKNSLKVAQDKVNELTKVFEEKGTTGLIKAITKMIVDGIEVIGEKAPLIAEKGQDLMRELRIVIENNKETIAQGLGNVILYAVKSVLQFKVELFSIGMDLIGEMARGFSEHKEEIKVAVSNAVFTLLNSIKDNLPDILMAGGDLLLALLEGIAEHPEQISETITEVINAISEFFNNNSDLIAECGVKIILAIVEGIINSLPQLVEATATLIGEIVKYVILNLPKIIELGGKLVLGIVDGFNNSMNNLEDAIWEGIKSIGQWFSEGWDKFKEAGGYIVDGIKTGIKSKWTDLKNSVKSWGSELVGSFKDFFGIHSPSTLMAKEIGQYLPQGIGVGFEDELPHLEKDVNYNLTGFTDGLKNNISNLKSNINIEQQPVIIYTTNINQLDGKEISKYTTKQAVNTINRNIKNKLLAGGVP